MSEKEIIERLIGIIERLLDENKQLMNSRYITAPTVPLTYPTPKTIPTTFPAPIVTCDTEVKA